MNNPSLCDFALPRFRIKKAFFIFVLIILFSLGAVAQNDSNPSGETRVMPADFKSDKCSLFPDCDYGDCCVEHDKTYYFGGTSKERWRADKKLYRCVRAKKGFHHKIIAPIMFIGVRIGGVSWLPTPFRWGFGIKKKPKMKNDSQSKNKNKSDKDD
jgi:hypothetical protein